MSNHRTGYTHGQALSVRGVLEEGATPMAAHIAIRQALLDTGLFLRVEVTHRGLRLEGRKDD